MRKELSLVLLCIVVIVVALHKTGCTVSAADSSQTYDVVIYGGTSAAVSAAVQAKRMGKTAIIVCPEKHLGGLTAGGLGWTDSGRKEAIGGISREFYQRLKKHYDKAEAWIYQNRSGPVQRVRPLRTGLPQGGYKAEQEAQHPWLSSG